MSSSDQDKELNGLARSIDALFTENDEAEVDSVRSETEDQPSEATPEESVEVGESDVGEPVAEAEVAAEPEEPAEEVVAAESEVEEPAEEVVAAESEAEEPAEEVVAAEPEVEEPAGEEPAEEVVAAESEAEEPAEEVVAVEPEVEEQSEDEPAEEEPVEEVVAAEAESEESAEDAEAVVASDVEEPEGEMPAEDAEAEAEPEAADSESEAQPAPAGEEIVWEEVQEARAPIGPADPEALAEAVDVFLKSDPLDRGGQGRTLREEALAHRESNALEPLANAVERLALEGGDPPDEACIAMAQALVSAGAASRVVAKLGAAREEERRAELMLVCQRIGHEMALAVADALSDTTDRFARRTFLECMVSMGQTSMDVVEEMAEDSRWFVVRNALAILGEVGGERAVELITATLAHTDPRVRREALLALAKVGGEDAGMLVYGMLEDPDPDVRLAAAMAAGALKVERALRPLLAILEDEEDPDVTIGILRALGQLGDPGATQLIEKRATGSFFSRPPVDVRIAAYRALQHIGTPHAKSLIEAAVDDKDPEVRTAVRQIKAQS